jgi:Uncharacterized protein conserved in bacteria
MRTFLASAAVTLVLAGAAFAQADHSGHGAPSQAAAESPATAAYQKANADMHGAMEIDYTGDPDIDFLLSMIPHHQGAIDMARVVIEHGSDPEIRALAEEIISAQEAEIAQMREWLAERGYGG